MAEAAKVADMQECETEDIETTLTDAINVQPDSRQLSNLKQIVARLHAGVPAKPSVDSDNTARARRLADNSRLLWNKAKNIFRDADDTHSELECELRSIAQEILGSALLLDQSLGIKPFLVRCAAASEAWMKLGSENAAGENRDAHEIVQNNRAKAEACLTLHETVLSTRDENCNAGALVDILIAKSRLSFAKDDMDESLRIITLVREKVETTQPDKADKLALQAFEFGRLRVAHNDAVPWLELSIDVQQNMRLRGDHTNSQVSNQTLARTYLLLAHCFLQDQRYDTCEIATKKAETICTSAASASLLLQCNIAQRKIADAKAHLTALVAHDDVSNNLPLAIHSLKIAAAAGLDVAPAIQTLLANPIISPEDKLTVRVFQLETALAETIEPQTLMSICDDIRQYHANDLVFAKPDNAVSTAMLERIQRSFDQWDDERSGLQAVDESQICCQEFMKFDFLSPEQDVCMARLLCYIKLRKNDVLGSAPYLQKVLDADPSSLATLVLHWRYAVQNKQVSGCKDALQQIIRIENDDKHSLLVSMTQVALEHGQHEIYLQCLQEQFRLGSGTAQQQVALLVDMIRVCEKLESAASVKLVKGLTEVDINMAKANADENSLLCGATPRYSLRLCPWSVVRLGGLA